LTIASGAPSRKGLQYWKGERERDGKIFSKFEANSIAPLKFH
jgi:hypothetical protein